MKGQISQDIAKAVILQQLIPIVLKSMGYSGSTATALELFSGLVEDFLKNLLLHVHSLMSHGRRTKPTSIDLFKVLRQRHISLHTIPRPLQPGSKLYVEKQPTKPDLFTTDLSKKPMRPKYLYDHLPELPPVHCFKKTLVRAKRESDKASLMVNRQQQIRMIESNLFSLLLKDKTIEFANYET